MKDKKQTTYDMLTEAQQILVNVREKMINALSESQQTENPFTSADFAEINALEEKLSVLRNAYAPEYKPFSFADLLKNQ